MKLPNIGIEWNYFKELDESHLDDLSAFGIIILVLIKGDDSTFVVYELDTQTWGLLQE